MCGFRLFVLCNCITVQGAKKHKKHVIHLFHTNNVVNFVQDEIDMSCFKML
jgi:hypothetical protein